MQKKEKEMKKLKHITRDKRLKELRAIVGTGGVRSLQTTGTLKIWKRSSPHNWWIESKRHDQVWHSRTTYDEGPRLYPNLDMFYTITLNIGDYLPQQWKLKEEYR